MSSVAVASKWLRFIFQLPLMSGFGGASGIGCSSQGLEAGQVAELEQLERGTTTGRDVVDVVLQAELRRAAAALSPPPTTVKPRASAMASATVRVPAAKRGSSNTPIGPFQKIGAGLGDDVEELGGGAGADVEAHPPVGQVGAHLAHLSAGVGIADLAARAERGDVVGDGDRRARVEQAPAGLDLVGLEQAGARPGGPGRRGR